MCRDLTFFNLHSFKERKKERKEKEKETNAPVLNTYLHLYGYFMDKLLQTSLFLLSISK